METVNESRLIERTDTINFINEQLKYLGYDELSGRETVIFAALLTKLDNKFGW